MTYYLYNPLPEDVSTTYNLDGDSKTYVLKAEKITEFDNEVIFRHLREFLVEAVLNYRDIIHFDANREKVRQEVVKNL